MCEGTQPNKRIHAEMSSGKLTCLAFTMQAMLMHHASLASVAWLNVPQRCQRATNHAIGLKSTPPKACKDDACKCAPQVHLILGAQSMHNRKTWQMLNKLSLSVCCLHMCFCPTRATTHFQETPNCSFVLPSKTLQEVAPTIGSKFAHPSNLQNGGFPADIISVLEPFAMFLIKKC